MRFLFFFNLPFKKFTKNNIENPRSSICSQEYRDMCFVEFYHCVFDKLMNKKQTGKIRQIQCEIQNVRMKRNISSIRLNSNVQLSRT